MADDKKASFLGDTKPHEHDPSWAGVQTKDRQFQNVPFAILFFGVVIGCVAASSWSFSHGRTNAALCQHAPDAFAYAVAMVKDNRGALGGMACLAFGIGLVWLLLLRVFAREAVYFTILAAIGLVIGAGVFLLTFSNSNIKIAGIVVLCFAAVLCLIAIWLRKKIEFTVRIMKEASSSIGANPGTLLVSVAMATVFIGVAAMLVASLVYLNCVPDQSQNVRLLFIFLLFGGFWIMLVLVGIVQVTVGGSTAIWYFSHNVNASSPLSPTMFSLSVALGKGFGSICVGTMVLAIVATLRFIISRAQKAAEGNRLASCILGCVQCLCSCIYGIIEFINQFALIYVAMHGKGFFTSCKEVMALIGRNPYSTVFAHALASVVLFLGKVMGVAACVLAMSGILKSKYGNELNSEQHPTAWVLTLTAMIAYAMMAFFAAVFEVAFDTVIVCYMEDVERNDKAGKMVSPQSMRDAVTEQHTGVKTYKENYDNHSNSTPGGAYGGGGTSNAGAATAYSQPTVAPAYTGITA